MTGRPVPARTAIRDRIIAVLNGATAAQDRVRANVTRKVLERLLEIGPVIRVYMFQGTGEKDGAEAHSYKRTMDVAVHLIAAEDDDTDAVLDRLAEDVEARLFNDRLLNGEVDGTAEPVAAEFDFDRFAFSPDDDTSAAHLVTIYRAVYYTDQPQRGTLDNFVTADIKTHPADGDADTPPAHDTLTLPQ